ncbi:MAG TPA: nucleotidyltransferase domain-containing protein [Bacilli bacterium]
MKRRLSAEMAATRFIGDYFPGCNAVIWAGSCAAGKGSSHSDIDLVIIDDTCERPFRQSYMAWGWPVEVFVITSDTYEDLFAANREAGTAALQRMIAEGRLLKDNGSGAPIIAEAKRQVAQGPAPWSLDEMNRCRYEITELLEDLKEPSNRGEHCFTALSLAEKVPIFLLRANECWIGEGKWLYKTLQQFAPEFARAWMDAIRDCIANGNAQAVTKLAEQALEPYGGKLFAGYYQESEY